MYLFICGTYCTTGTEYNKRCLPALASLQISKSREGAQGFSFFPGAPAEQVESGLLEAFLS